MKAAPLFPHPDKLSASVSGFWGICGYSSFPLVTRPTVEHPAPTPGCSGERVPLGGSRERFSGGSRKERFRSTDHPYFHTHGVRIPRRAYHTHGTKAEFSAGLIPRPRRSPQSPWRAQGFESQVLGVTAAPSALVAPTSAVLRLAAPSLPSPGACVPRCGEPPRTVLRHWKPDLRRTESKE